MDRISDQFRLVLPDGWEDRTVHTFMGPDDSGVRHMLSVVVDRDCGGLELPQFARERINALTEPLQSYEVLKDEEKELPGGKTVHEFVYKWIPLDGRIIYQKVIYMIIDGIGYSFSANFSKKTIKTIGRQVDLIVDSFGSPAKE
jgi:hypothetical protein